MRLHNGARPVLTKVYARECYSRRRPFIGLNKHAERLFVDTRPGEFETARKARCLDLFLCSSHFQICCHILYCTLVAASGFHKWREDSRVDKVMEAFAKVLKNPAYKHAVVYNPDATVDRDAAAAAGKEGSNDYRPPEVKPEDEETFAVSVPSQAIGLRLAEELYGAFCELFPEEEHAVEQHETRRANRSERRRVAKEAKHRHMLRIIAQRKDLLRKVPRGSIDKFIELDRQGQFEDSPVEGDAEEEGARQ